MIKKLIPIIFIFLLTGCYDYKELNSINIISASTINKIDNNYIVTVEAINPQAPEKMAIESVPFIIYKGEGKSIQEAYRNITTTSSRFLYSNHLQILFINENLAKNDIENIIDFYIRNPAIRTEFYVLITKNDTIMNTITPINELSAASIKENLNTNNKYLGTISPITFNDLTKMYLNKNEEIVIPVIEFEKNNIEGDSVDNTSTTVIKQNYMINHYAIFKNNKLINYLTPEESKTYNILNNKINNTILTYECNENKYITLEVIKSETKITPKDNSINIEINMKGNINEYNCDKSLSNKKELQQIKKLLEDNLKKEIETNINNIKKYNTDIFNFKELYYKYNYKTYKKINTNWYKDIYKNLNINIKTNIKIIETGNNMEEINEKS